MSQRRGCRLLLTGVAAVGLACTMAVAQEPMKVGEHYPIYVDSRGASDVEGISTATGQVFVITHPDATYMGVHFAKFQLAAGDFVVVSDADGGQSYTLEGKGKMSSGKFWSQHIKGDTIVLELVGTTDKPNRGFTIDQYAAGFVNLDPTIERICGANDFENAVCYSGTTEYDKARAVARLLIRNMYLCTGWLASANDHFITNEHCITSATDALNTDYEFMAEAPNCSDSNCQLCWDGTIYSGSAFIQDNPALDYALVQLNGNPAATYGYLEIDDRDAIVGETIYMPAHPSGRAKEFGYYCDPNTPYADGRCRVTTVTAPGCSSTSYNDVGYWIDTEGGSSGSPVLAASSHKVIALHHCHNYCDSGGAENRGVPIDLVCAEVCSLLGGGGPECVVNGDCDTGEICCNEMCVTPVCTTGADCNDGNSCTTDTCTDGGTCAAACSYDWPACGPSDGCCGPTCDSSDPDCCGVRGDPCTANADCCSGRCHPRKLTCK